MVKKDDNMIQFTPLPPNLFDIEMDDFSHLLLLLSSARICAMDDDSLLRWPNSSGFFLVKSFYVLNIQCDYAPLVHHAIWSSKAPPHAISFPHPKQSI